MKRPMLPLKLLMIVLLAGCNNLTVNSDSDFVYEASIGEPFELTAGYTAILDGVNVRITFEELAGDSRCPVTTEGPQLECVWEGQIEANFVFQDGDAAPVEFQFVGFVQEGTPVLEKTFGRYVLTLFQMSPYPTHPNPAMGPAVATVQLDFAE